MAVFDNHANLIKVTVSVAPSTPTSGTTLSVSNADGVILRTALTAPFNITVCPANGIIDPATSEIIRITAIGAADSGGAGNTQLTITRQAEVGGINRSVVIGDIMYLTPTKKTFTDIETASTISIQSAVSGADFTTTSTTYVDSTASTSSVSLTLTVTSNVLIMVTGVAQNDTDTSYYVLGIGKGTNTAILTRSVDPAHVATGSIFNLTHLDAAVAPGTYVYHMGAYGQAAKIIHIVAGARITAIAFPV